MNTLPEPAPPVTRMYVYEMTHPTSEQLNGYVFTLRCETREDADYQAGKFASARGCGFRLKQNGEG